MLSTVAAEPGAESCISRVMEMTSIMGRRVVLLDVVVFFTVDAELSSDSEAVVVLIPEEGWSSDSGGNAVGL